MQLLILAGMRRQVLLLEHLIGAGGGAKEAATARVRCAWATFRELAQVLTSRRASLKMKGKVYTGPKFTMTWYMRVKHWPYGSGRYGKIGENGTKDSRVDV